MKQPYGGTFSPSDVIGELQTKLLNSSKNLEELFNWDSCIVTIVSDKHLMNIELPQHICL